MKMKKKKKKSSDGKGERLKRPTGCVHRHVTRTDHQGKCVLFAEVAVLKRVVTISVS